MPVLRPNLAPRALLAVVLWVVSGCADCGGMSEPNVPLSTRPSLGELVYRVIKGRLATTDQCSNEYVAELEVHHTDFVTTFDYVIETGVTDDFPDLLGGTIKPFVDDDKLPRLVDTMAATLALLVSDEFDPERATLQSMVNLAESQTLIESSVAIQLVAAILVDDSIQDKVHALAVIAQEDDGVTYVMDDLLDVASYALEADDTPSTCSGVTLPDAQSTLLRTEGFVEDPRFALETPFYLARPDTNGNPAVLSDGGVMRGPFVDLDGDLVADVDADLHPIDAAGMPIDLPMIAEDGAPGRDEFGRAIDDQGRLVYDYYDVKRTTLSYSAQIAADLIETGIHHDVPAVVNAALGAPIECDEGTNCRLYPSAGNVVADLTWFFFEIAEYGRIPVLMHTLTDLLTTDPTKSEELLVAIGDVIRAFQGTTLSMTDTELTAAIRGLVPMIAQILTTPNAGTTPTARLLVDMFQGLGDRVDTIPTDVRYSLLNQYDADTANKRDTVDLSAPRFLPNGDDNRSGLEQIVELFEYADCGYIGPATSADSVLRGLLWGVLNTIDGGNLHPGTFTEVVVEFLSHRTPETVSTLADLIDGIQGLVGNNTLAWVLQNGTGGSGHTACSAADSQATAQLLPLLKFLSESGGLDWILPLADTFVQAGQRRLLIDFFDYLALELRRDEDANPATTSAIRKIGPALVQLSTNPAGAPPNSTPLNRIFDAFDILLAIPASDGNGNAVDVVIDAVGYATATRSVSTRPTTAGGAPGSTSNSIAVLLLEKFEVLQKRVRDGGAGDELSRIVGGITPLLTDTTGSGAARRLANPNLRLLMATYTTVLADASSLPNADYLCYVHDLQLESAELMTTKHCATLVRVLAHLATSPNAAALEDWIVSLMRGDADRSTEVYGRMMQLVAGALSSEASGDDLSQILAWLSAGLRGSEDGGIREMVATFDELLTRDTNGSILTMTRSLFAPGPLESMARPVSTYAEVVSDVGAVDPGNSCMATGREIDVASMSDTVSGLVDFMTRDPDDGVTTGIEQVWSLVGTIAPNE